MALSGIPIRIVKLVVSKFPKQLDRITSFSETILQKILVLPDDVTCDDPAVVELKRDLQNLQTSIQQINKYLNQITPVVSTLVTVSNVGKVILEATKAPLATPGAPPEPAETTIDDLTKLLNNVKGCSTVFLGVVLTAKSCFNRVDSIIALVVSKLSSICHNDQFPVTPRVNDLIGKQITSINAGSITFDTDYPSEFYRKINVSDDDIERRFNLIQQLLDDDLNVLKSLYENPTNYIAKSGTPTATDGDINDYYLDTTNNKLYGPKTTVSGSEWGNPIN